MQALPKSTCFLKGPFPPLRDRPKIGDKNHTPQHSRLALDGLQDCTMQYGTAGDRVEQSGLAGVEIVSLADLKSIQ